MYRAALPVDVKGFDPAHADDQYSVIAIKQIYETLLRYNYIKRPYELEPLLAEELPTVSDSGLVYTFKIKKGVRFQSDPCFSGSVRFLSAHDFIYSIKRLADIKVKSSGWWIFDDRIVGLDEFRKHSTETSKTDYELPVSGLTAPDSFTLVIRLKRAFPQFSYLFAMQFTSAVAHEAVAYYGEEFLNHPIGTGPFIITEWRRRLRIKLVRSPTFRGIPSPFGDGEMLPYIDTLVLNIFNESEPMWFTFQRMGLEAAWIPKDNFDRTVGPDMSLNPSLISKGISIGANPSLDVTYTCFNMEDSLLGKNLHLRRAISLAYNTQKAIELLYNNRAIPAHSPIPPGLFGYEENFVNPYQRYDTAAAKREMELAGYKMGEGLPEISYLETDNALSRQWSDKFKQEMAVIGVRIRVDAVTWPEFLKRFRNKKFQIAGAGWGADYPDPENFLQLLYGPNEAPGTNNANYKNREYDSLYTMLATNLDDSTKMHIIRRMKKIVADDCPWIPGTHRLAVGLRYNWVKNYIFSDISSGDYCYLSIDTALRNSRIRESKR